MKVRREDDAVTTRREDDAVRTAPAAGESPRAVAAVFVAGQAERAVVSVRSLLEHAGVPVVVGTSDPRSAEHLGSLGIDALEVRTAPDLVNAVWQQWGCHVLAADDAVAVPPGFLDRALDIADADLRVATVSFWSNSAAFLSFPGRNTPALRPVEGHDEVSITRLLRERGPAPGPVPVPFAAGGIVLLSASALATLGGLAESPSGVLAPSVADFCLRGRRRGFLDVLDAATFCARPSDVSFGLRPDEAASGLSRGEQAWLETRHPLAAAVLDQDAAPASSPLGLALGVARSKVRGLSVAVDGSYLGPHETGVQVTLLAMVRALAERDDVAHVAVTLSGPVPPYARDLFAQPRVIPVTGGPEALGRTDVAHRPVQPDAGFDVARWRSVAERVVVTVHDLIAYRNAAYHQDAQSWAGYRDAMRAAVRQVDAVVAVSEDVAAQLRSEGLTPEPSRLFVAHQGTDHLRGDEAARVPVELLARGFAAADFIVCLGTNYAHKNRDLAVASVQELRRRGYGHALVMVGAAVPWGSSRADEAAVGCGTSDTFVLPDVSSEERNWLLRHAALVLYPTSAEGFGLVPFEAARFGTPTLTVGFGPLAEVGGLLPVTAARWEASALADAAEALLGDPSLAEAQVKASLSAGETYTWAATAARLVGAYRDVLAMPPR